MKAKEKIMECVFLLTAVVSILAVALICIFLFANGIPAMKEIGFSNFLLGKEWKPGNDIYGIFPMIKFYLPVMCCLTCVSAEFLKELRSKCGTVCKKLKHYLMMWLFMPDTNIRRGRCVWQWRAGKRRQWKNIWRWLTRG